MKRIIYGYFYEDEELCMVHGQEPDAEIKYFNNKQALMIDGDKIFINHRKVVEIPTCPRCNSENVHIWKRQAQKGGNNDGYFTFFNFKCRDCSLKRKVRTDAAYFRKLIDTDKEDQAGYLVGLLNRQGNAFVSAWILDLFNGKDILEKWLCDETGLNVVLREANDPEIKAEGHMIAEVQK